MYYIYANDTGCQWAPVSPPLCVAERGAVHYFGSFGVTWPVTSTWYISFCCLHWFQCNISKKPALNFNRKRFTALSANPVILCTSAMSCESEYISICLEKETGFIPTAVIFLFILRFERQGVTSLSCALNELVKLVKGLVLPLATQASYNLGRRSHLYVIKKNICLSRSIGFKKNVSTCAPFLRITVVWSNRC